MRERIVKIRDLGVQYDSVTALEHVDLDILVGPLQTHHL